MARKQSATRLTRSAGSEDRSTAMAIPTNRAPKNERIDTGRFWELGLCAVAADEGDQVVK